MARSAITAKKSTRRIMSQTSLNLPVTLNSFEQITLDAQVSYKASKEEDITRLLNSDKLKLEVIVMVGRWNSNRAKLGLKPFS